jgi:ATP-dependent exoDNAse (exonuclease V) beta subunit
MAIKDMETGDADARAAALDPSGSFIVQAPAGSGKTELLMRRYLTLLAAVERPEEVLALTFTRKAASGMRGRIIGALTKARDGARAAVPHEARTLDLAREALKRDSILGWGVLEAPTRLRVETIDSFSAYLNRRMPLLARSWGQASVSDKPEPFYREAARRAIGLVEDEGPLGEAVRTALRHLDNSARALEARLAAMLGRRDQWLRHVSGAPAEGALREALEGSLTRLVEAALEDLGGAFPPGVLSAVVRSAAAAAENVDDGSPIKALRGRKGAPGASIEDLPLWKGLAGMLLTKEGVLRKPGGVNSRIGVLPGGGKEAFQEVLKSLEGDPALPALIERLSRARSLPQPRYGEEEWAALMALLRLLPEAERLLNGVFREAGATDFQAVSMAALASLGADDAPTDLMLSLDMSIRHILVDEYQDTSQAQLELIKALTRGWVEGDGRTLFVVGDPMQSIYLFREAEVGLFLDARSNGIGGVRLEPLALGRNFRSAPSIVGWVNSLFGSVFPEAEDPLTGSVRYAPSEAAVSEDDGPGVSIRLFEGRDDAGEAEAVLSIIKGLAEGETTAILCRSRTHLEGILPALAMAKVRFRARGIDPLRTSPVVEDLLSLLRAMYFPFDRVSWLSVLRSPVCGLGLHDLHRLCLGDVEGPIADALHDARRLNALSEDGAARLARVTLTIDAALELRGRLQARRLLEGLWVALGGPACVDDGSMKDAEAFFDLLGSVSEAGKVDFKGLAERLKDLYADHGAEVGAVVELMTIHKAKGLEFDHVIVPGMGRPPRATSGRLLIWMEDREDLFLAPMEKRRKGVVSELYGYLNGIYREKESLELARLLYVACTRARKGLYLLGGSDPRAKGRDPEKRSFLSLLGGLMDGGRSVAGPHARSEGAPLQSDGANGADEADGTDDTADLSEGKRPDVRLKRLKTGWEAPAPAPPAWSGPGAGAAEATLEPEFQWAGAAARRLGIVVHAYLCRIAREGLERWGEGRLKRESRVVAAELRTLGLSRAEAGVGAKKAMEIITGALTDGRGRWALGGHEDAGVETPISGVVAGDVVHAVIDRTFVDEEGARWVIDYKTGAHEGGSLAEFLDNERQRYGAQMEVYASLMRAMGEERVIKKGLYYPALKAWIAW